MSSFRTCEQKPFTRPIDFGLLLFCFLLLAPANPSFVSADPSTEADATPVLICPGDTIRYRYGAEATGQFLLSEVTDPDTTTLPFERVLILYAGDDSLVVPPSKEPTRIVLASPADTVSEVVIFANKKLEVLQKHARFNETDEREIPPFTYSSADDENLRELREQYDLDSVVGSGGEVARIISLMRWTHGIVRHDGSSTNPSPRNAIHLIEVCKEEDRGINCRMMATILNEAYLSFGYPSRHITCLPYDKDDNDCHVITAVYSDSLGKWLLMDPTFEAYLSTPEGEVLGPMEIRDRLITEQPIVVNSEINWNGSPYDPDGYLLYLTKNLFRFSCPIQSEFGYESKEGPRSWVHLNPIGYDDSAEAETDSTGTYVVDYVTQSVDRFWAPPTGD